MDSTSTRTIINSAGASLIIPDLVLNAFQSNRFVSFFNTLKDSYAEEADLCFTYLHRILNDRDTPPKIKTFLLSIVWNLSGESIQLASTFLSGFNSFIGDRSKPEKIQYIYDRATAAANDDVDSSISFIRFICQYYHFKGTKPNVAEVALNTFHSYLSGIKLTAKEPADGRYILTPLELVQIGYLKDADGVNIDFSLNHTGTPKFNEGNEIYINGRVLSSGGRTDMTAEAFKTALTSSLGVSEAQAGYLANFTQQTLLGMSKNPLIAVLAKSTDSAYIFLSQAKPLSTSQSIHYTNDESGKFKVKAEIKYNGLKYGEVMIPLDLSISSHFELNADHHLQLVSIDFSGKDALFMLEVMRLNKFPELAAALEILAGLSEAERAKPDFSVIKNALFRVVVADSSTPQSVQNFLPNLELLKQSLIANQIKFLKACLLLSTKDAAITARVTAAQQAYKDSLLAYAAALSGKTRPEIDDFAEALSTIPADTLTRALTPKELRPYQYMKANLPSASFPDAGLKGEADFLVSSLFDLIPAHTLAYKYENLVPLYENNDNAHKARNDFKTVFLKEYENPRKRTEKEELAKWYLQQVYDATSPLSKLMTRFDSIKPTCYQALICDAAGKEAWVPAAKTHHTIVAKLMRDFPDLNTFSLVKAKDSPAAATVEDPISRRSTSTITTASSESATDTVPDAASTKSAATTAVTANPRVPSTAAYCASNTTRWWARSEFWIRARTVISTVCLANTPLALIVGLWRAIPAAGVGTRNAVAANCARKSESTMPFKAIGTKSTLPKAQWTGTIDATA